MGKVRFSSDSQVFRKAEAQFEASVRVLRGLLPWAEFHHVGSTAVPGSLTKGDLDIAVRVPQERFGEAEQTLAAAFDRNAESDLTQDFAAFEDGRVEPHLGIQLVAIGTESDNFHIWAERLQTDEALRSEYDGLKRRHQGGDMAEYRSAKTAFIEKWIRK